MDATKYQLINTAEELSKHQAIGFALDNRRY